MSDFIAQWGPGLGVLASVGQVLAFTIVLSLSVAAAVLIDRKIWAAVQMRKGPNVVGPFGVLQTIADALKFFLKEIVVPTGADRVLFLLAPLITLVLAFIGWAVVPVAPGWVIADINVGILYLFAVSSLGVYGIIIGGWASNSKYPFLGALRSAAQMVSYEVSIGFVIVTVLLLVGSLNLSAIVENQAGGLLHWHALQLFDLSGRFSPTIVIMFPMFVIFFVSALAETNRPPFDLPDAESELVAGYQVEYSSTPFLMYFFGEYLNIMLMCAMLTVLFFGGWHAPFPQLDITPGFTIVPPVLWFVGKLLFFFFMFAMVKAIVPRYRYDQLMRLGWKVFLPTTLVAVAAVGAYVTYAR
jgi:NADH-quinone oxidoreductase subunit H